MSASNQVEKHEAVTITDGTKGGRSRTVPIVTREQTAILNRAARLQGKDRSLIPAHLSYQAYRNQAYQALKGTPLTGFHGHRHEYAQERYQQLTGCACPVVAQVPHGSAHHRHLASQLHLSLEVARETDRQARLQVALELGHNRINITNSYLG